MFTGAEVTRCPADSVGDFELKLRLSAVGVADFVPVALSSALEFVEDPARLADAFVGAITGVTLCPYASCPVKRTVCASMRAVSLAQRDCDMF